MPKVQETLLEKSVKRAAFYDVDGTLASVNVLHAYAYYAATDRGIASKLKRLATMAANLPVYGVLETISRKAFNEYFFHAYKGISEDRLWLIGEEVFEDVIRPALYPGVRDMFAKSKEQGIWQVLVTGGIEQITAPLARYLGADDYAANRLELDRGIATGSLRPPVLAGPGKSDWIRAYAKEKGIDLEQSFAYSDSYSDLPMLSVVGRPCAMNPDRKLKQVAQEHHWQIVDFRSN